MKLDFLTLPATITSIGDTIDQILREKADARVLITNSDPTPDQAGDLPAVLGTGAGLGGANNVGVYLSDGVGVAAQEAEADALDQITVTEANGRWTFVDAASGDNLAEEIYDNVNRSHLSGWGEVIASMVAGKVLGDKMGLLIDQPRKKCAIIPSGGTAFTAGGDNFEAKAKFGDITRLDQGWGEAA